MVLDTEQVPNSPLTCWRGVSRGLSGYRPVNQRAARWRPARRICRPSNCVPPCTGRWSHRAGRTHPGRRSLGPRLDRCRVAARHRGARSPRPPCTACPTMRCGCSCRYQAAACRPQARNRKRIPQDTPRPWHKTPNTPARRGREGSRMCAPRRSRGFRCTGHKSRWQRRLGKSRMQNRRWGSRARNQADRCTPHKSPWGDTPAAHRKRPRDRDRPPRPCRHPVARSPGVPPRHKPRPGIPGRRHTENRLRRPDSNAPQGTLPPRDTRAGPPRRYAPHPTEKPRRPYTRQTSPAADLETSEYRRRNRRREPSS